jgi:pimeloyl-ACP methyl ester carboxylesterase
MRVGQTLSAVSVILATLGCAPPGPKVQAEKTDAYRSLVQVGPPVNAAISYLHAGDPTATRLILVHGTPGSAQAWTDYVVQPPEGVEVIALDRPGFGRSGPNQAVTSLALQAAAVAGLLPTDGRRAVLVGHSLGGAVIARVAIDHPAQVSALVFVAASLDPAQEKLHPVQPLAAAWPLRVLLPRALRNSNDELMVFKSELEALALHLGQIRVPYIIVHGTEDDLVPVANVPFMQARLSGSVCNKTILLPGLNHFLPWNSESVLRDAIQWALHAPC